MALCLSLPVSKTIGRLRPLHPDTLAVGVDHDRIGGQHVIHASGLPTRWPRWAHRRADGWPGRRAGSGAPPRWWTTAPAPRLPRRIRASARSRAQLFGRRGTHLSAMFPEIVEVLPAALGGRTAIVDGEIVALDHRARPSFSRLQRRLRSPRPRALVSAVPAGLFVFDVLHWAGRDVTGSALYTAAGLVGRPGDRRRSAGPSATGVAGRNRRHHPRCRGSVRP